MSLYTEIVEEARGLLPQICADRRDFHKYAERGWFEFRTSSIIAERLSSLGYRVLVGRELTKDESRLGLASEEELERQYQRALSQGAIERWAEKMRGGFTGVIGEVRCGPGAVIALRFDIDALGVYEDDSAEHRPAAEGFRSVNEGAMHACGHDGHTAVGLAVAELLMRHRDKINGTVRLIFQPAEEGVRGANAVVAAGHLDDADYLIGVHVSDGKDVDYAIDANAGVEAGTAKYDVTFRGLASHAGGAPEKGNNAMLAAATAVLNLQAIPRCASGITRVNVGTLHAGSGRNVICDRAVMEMEVRGTSSESLAFMRDYALRIVKTAAEMHGCECEVKLTGVAEALTNDPSMIARCERVCREKLGISAGHRALVKGSSDDCACMIEAVRRHGGEGLYFLVLNDLRSPLHSRTFDFDEGTLVNAVAVFCGLVFDISETEGTKTSARA